MNPSDFFEEFTQKYNVPLHIARDREMANALEMSLIEYSAEPLSSLTPVDAAAPIAATKAVARPVNDDSGWLYDDAWMYASMDSSVDWFPDDEVAA